MICVVNGKPITFDALAPVLKVEGRWSLVGEAVREAVLDAAVAAQGIRVTDEDLQRAANEFRIARGLHRAAAMLAWLDAERMTIEDLERGLERGLTTAKLREAIDPEEVRRYFFDHREQFQWARFSHLIAADREVAVELLAQIRDSEVGFASVARRQSIDPETGPAGGYAGTLARSDLSPALASLVFSVPLAEAHGPVETDAGWHLVKVWDRGGEAFDVAAAAAARDAVFEHWLQREIGRAQVEINL